MTEITQGLNAPFLISWLGVWLFALLGGVVSAFIRIGDIDNRLLYPFVSKPLIGMATGLSLAVAINGNVEPPPVSLIAWAFVGSICSTPIITGFLVFISDQNRQNELYKSAQDKFVPWSRTKKESDNDNNRG